MRQRIARWQVWLVWAVPAIVCALALGWEIDWGRQLHRLPGAPAAVAPRPVSLAVLPEYGIDGGIPGHAETVNRTLFNPTRRPAPPVVVEATATKMQRGQFALTGTTVSGDRNVAFLREVTGGRSRMVKQGDEINGMRVAEVKPDRVKLLMGGESEEIVLKVAIGPRVPPAPAGAPQAAPGPQPVPGQASQFGPLPPGQQPPATPTPAAGQPAAETNVQERRRAARAAAAQQAGVAAQPPPAAPVATPAPVAPAQAVTDPAWNDVYRRMQQRQK